VVVGDRRGRRGDGRSAKDARAASWVAIVESRVDRWRQDGLNVFLLLGQPWSSRAHPPLAILFRWRKKTAHTPCGVNSLRKSNQIKSKAGVRKGLARDSS
jgi:hypothetical protein